METEWADGCYTTKTKESGKFASICDIVSISDLMSMDFSHSAKCNYYLTEDKFGYMPSVMAVQVWIHISVKFKRKRTNMTAYDLKSNHKQFQKGSGILNEVDYLINMAKQMGLIGAQINAALPNANKCSSWQNIQASHVSTEHAPLTMKAFFGSLSLMAFGVGVSLIGFCAEKFIFMYYKHTDNKKP